MPDPYARSREQLAGDSITPATFATRPGRSVALTEEAKAAGETLRSRAVRSGFLSPRGYNLSICHERRFLWFRVAKVGTRTLFDHFARHDVHLDAEQPANLRYPAALFDDYFAFAFVREPVARFVSAWQNKVIKNNLFDFDDATRARMQELPEFVTWAESLDLDSADRHIAPQSRLVDLTRVDFLGRMETFAEDVAAVCQRIGVPGADLPRLNVSRPTDTGLDTELARRIAALYERDFQIFGYERP